MINEKANKERAEKLLVFLEKNGTLLCFSGFLFQLMYFLAGYVFRSSNIIINATLFFISVFFYLISKDFFEEDRGDMFFNLFKCSILILPMSIVNTVFLTMANTLREQGSGGGIFNVSFFINFIIAIGFLYASKQEALKENLELVREGSLLAKVGILEKSTEVKEGDVKIGKVKETGEPAVIPFKDRFLHMLILGPTGSGKTSQVIIPMIRQDIQNMNCGITVIEPKADLAEKVYAMAEYYGRENVMYFNPILPDCPYFNPLAGKETDVIENMSTTFKMLGGGDSPPFFQDMNDTLLRNALKVLKRLYGDDATLIDLHTLISNPNRQGEKMVLEFSRLNTETTELAKENLDVSYYFKEDYFFEKSRTYEHCSGMRTQVSKLISNKYLRKVLNPPRGRNDINFDAHLEKGGVVAIATAQGTLRDLGRFLGYFIILQLQASVFRRPGNENNRKAHFLYIDEFQVYANPGFADMLTQGRSYRVASHLATQNRALIGMGRGQDGKDFLELVSTNARNLILYPGGNILDAEYYSKQFGEERKKEVQKGVTRTKFSVFHLHKGSNAPSENIRETEKLEAKFTASDLIYRPFGEITYCLMKNASIQPPEVGIVEWIPKDLNDTLDDMIEKYNNEQFNKSDDGPKPNAPVVPDIPEIDMGGTQETLLDPLASTSANETKTSQGSTNNNPKSNKFQEVKTSKNDNRNYVESNNDYTQDLVITADDDDVETF